MIHQTAIISLYSINPLYF